MNKRLGQDFKALAQEAREIPEVRDYLDSFSVVIGNIVFARRMQLKLSQQQLAALAQTTQGRISQLESATGNIRQDVMDRVFKVLELQDLKASFDEQAVARA
ncbi:helix-turn-helix domain-containing protein [Paenibacillus agilis]|uniref:Helix-turn-helix domain-containing protein n=1 Tax=Paenibacillus agilis TaxID=3020863 RepID=A0A559ID34_9BACL|nr:helix-turn-helix domain-containing protein [Paenibacillus agilis]TVX85536.1 helix-turn-helix domain-containing protein [Paenibacillus agilis]